MLLIWRRLLRVPWTARRPNQSISPEYSLEGLMLKLKLQYFGHLTRKTDSLEKTLMLGRLRTGGERDDTGWDGWMGSPAQWTWVWAISVSWRWTGKPGLLQSMGLQRVRHDWATELRDKDLNIWLKELINTSIGSDFQEEWQIDEANSFEIKEALRIVLNGTNITCLWLSILGEAVCTTERSVIS